MVDSLAKRSTVFISYSHRDIAYFKRLRLHLEPHVREGLFEVWDDTRILPETRWKEGVEEAIASAKVAILLVSADFLASDYIYYDELTPLLKAAEQKGVLIVSVILRPCDFEMSELAHYQSINPPFKPLSSMNFVKREATWAKLVKSVSDALSQVSPDSTPPQAPQPRIVPPEEQKKSLPSLSQFSSPKVFVSHSHKNDDFTTRFVEDLRAAGGDVWVDMVDMQHGDFMTRINEAPSASEWLVLVLTPDALASPAVQTEVNAALNMVWLKELKGVIPFMAVPCESKSIPPIWKNLHRYDATKDYKQALAGLLQALGIENS